MKNFFATIIAAAFLLTGSAMAGAKNMSPTMTHGKPMMASKHIANKHSKKHTKKMMARKHHRNHRKHSAKRHHSM